MSGLDGRTALVTGGSDGIGLAIARALAEAGADLVLLARDPGKLDAAAATLAGFGAAVRTAAVDLTDLTALEEAVGPVADDVDILVNNVGVAHLTPIADVTPAQFDAMVTVNLGVPVRLVQLLLPSLVARRGSVVTVSSYWARKTVAGRPSAVYSATRGAQESFTRALANELGPQGVRVNAVAPGAVRTPTFERTFLGAMDDERRAGYEASVHDAYPAGRIGEPADVAAAVRYLVSDEAAWITGTILPVDGGLTVR